MNADERKAAFLDDFKALLRKHDAEFEMPRHSDGPAEVWMHERTENGRVVDAQACVALPTFVCGKE